ncbi:TPA: hypothetical protein DEP58_03695 [Patescibacteria group bacterium]|nr:MAG: hypothetical protein UU98_C0008G0012 [Parcubacteria group bacterium GW2011_GWD2_42_14]HCC05377.1 hypothetical protein [Patescibacteria group bacterium]
MQGHYIFTAATIALLVLTALCVYSPAEAGSVQNNFTVRAGSGGNTAEDGEIVTGETKSSVDIKTTVDGEVVEEIHETSTDGYLRIESTVISNNQKSFATTTVEARTTQNASGTNTFTDEPVVYTTSPSTIITLTETSNESSTEFESTEHTSFFARLFTRISTTFTYVLSRLFS